MDDIREVQLTGLEILKDIASFCEERGIRYYLYCGTLLGCIRHGGFIPWDDDIDLAMPLEDFDRFRKEFFTANRDRYEEGYFTPAKDRYRHLWLQVVRKGTTYCEKDVLLFDMPHGMYVDVYPLIGIPENNTLKKLQFWLIRFARFMLNGDEKRFLELKSEGWRSRLDFLYILPRGFRVTLAKLAVRLSYHSPQKHRRGSTIDGAIFADKYDITIFDDPVKRTFEDGQFYTPKDYDTILRIMYGEYMQLPPEEKRIPHWRDPVIDMHRDYREYQKDAAAEIK